MAVRIKTISNEILGQDKPERGHAHMQKKDESRQSNKILELEWEALGRKLNKHSGNGAELERLRQQVRERDEMLRQANQKIAALKKQISSLQDKHRAPDPKRANYNRFNAPSRAPKRAPARANK